MLLYSFIVLPVGFILLYLSYAIYKGKTELIHDYHQTNVEDKAAYGKGFGKALAVFSVGPILSGIVALFGETDLIMMIAVVVLFGGMIAGFYRIYKVQKKYNSGVF